MAESYYTGSGRCRGGQRRADAKARETAGRPSLWPVCPDLVSRTAPATRLTTLFTMSDSTDTTATDREHSAATDLQASVEQLEAQLAARQQRIDELEARLAALVTESVPIPALRAVLLAVRLAPASTDRLIETVQAVDQEVAADV